MNLFSSEPFLEAYGAAYFPTHKRQVADFEVAGRRLRTLLLNEHQPLCDGPFFDFLQPLESPEASAAARALRWVPRTVVQTHPVSDISFRAEGGQPSPYIDWRLFPRWADFEAHAAARRSGLWSDSRRKWRKLERDVGPVVFRLEDRDPQRFEQLLHWKSAQYRRSNLQDRFANGQGRRFFEAMMASGAAVCSTLCAGDTLVAGHLGGLWNRRFYWWVPTYDPERSAFSPGRLLLHALLQARHEAGDEEFDFLIGDEDYKFYYATHNRVVGEMGTPPARVLVDRGVRRLVRTAFAPFPGVMALSRKLRSRWASR